MAFVSSVLFVYFFRCKLHIRNINKKQIVMSVVATKRVIMSNKILHLEKTSVVTFLNEIFSSRPPTSMYPYPPAPPYPPYMPPPPPRPPMPQQPMPGMQPPPPSYRQAMQQPRPNLGPRPQMPPSRSSMNPRQSLPSRPQAVAIRQRVPPQRIRPGSAIREQRPKMSSHMSQNGQYITNNQGQKVLVKRHPEQMHNLHAKRKRMDILMPNKNDDADCQLISVQPKNSGLPQIQSVQVTRNGSF